MKIRSLVLLISFVALSGTVSFAQTGPGGVGTAATNFLYLKADAGTSTTTNNVSLSAWNDQSGNANNFSQGTGSNQPTFKTAGPNGFPLISFNGTSSSLTGPSVFPTSSDYTKFVVGQINSTAPNNNFFSGTNNHAFYMGSGNLRPRLFHNGDFVTSSISINLNQFYILSGTLVNSSRLGEVFVNGASGGVGTAAVVNNDATMFLGTYGGGNFLSGDMSEIIAYNFKLNTAQRTIVENYLSAKYAITISNSRYSYASTHSTDVAGIGRFNVTNTHLAARSGRILDISEPGAGSLADGDYLLAGHDNSSIAAWSTFETPTALTNIQRLPREWRVTKTGTVATVTLGIDNSVLPARPASYTKYVLLVDADGDFTSGATVFELPSIGGTQFARTGMVIADGSYLAVGVVNPTVQFTSTTSESFENAAFAVPVSLNYNPASPVTVNYASASGSAISGTDFSLASGTATITAGNTSTTILPTITNDVLVETDENFTITLSSPSAGITLGSNSVNTYTIHDDDNARKIQFNTASSSGAESVTAFSITVSLNNVDATNPTTVDYSVTGGTATGGGVDFTLASGTATIAANATSTTIPVTVADDAIYELNETIIISLTNPINSNLGTNTQHTYTINDNDGLPVVGFSGSSSSGLESVSPANFPLIQSIQSYISSQVSYTVSGTATGGGVDYTLSNGTITIPAGSTSANIVATILNDVTTEANETIVVTLSSPVNCTLGTTVYTYTILDDDPFGWTGPGGVGDNLTNILWLRADLGTGQTVNAAAVSTWSDQSGSGNNATQGSAGNRPTFQTNQINSLPAVRFNGSSQLMTCPSVFPTNSNYTKLIVIKLNNSGATNNVISGSAGHAFFFGGSTAPLLFHNGTFVTSSLTVTVGTFAISTGTFINSSKTGQIYLNGTSGGTGTTANANTDATIQIGAYAGSNLLNGDLAEGIAYNVLLNTAQRNIVENYLSSKYSIAISNDKYPYDATHGVEVAGIGRDDSNNLHFDAKGSGLVRINTASSLDDGDYLIWGHNGASLGSGNSSDVPSGIISRMNRVWRAAQTASVGTVSISFDLTGLTVNSVNDIELLTDADGTFAAGATRFTTGRGYNPTTHIVSFTGLSLPNGTFFTLGSNNPATTLPIQLVSFTATANRETKTVDVKWKTASEINNDFFTVERSLDGGEWAALERIPGAGTSTVSNNYAYEDALPFSGQSFYRLRQTDYDGKSKVSNVVSVNFDQDNFLEVYPNPASDKITVSVRTPSPVVITNITGTVYFNRQVSEPVLVQTGDLPPGLYIVRSHDHGKLVTRKLIVDHK